MQTTDELLSLSQTHSHCWMETQKHNPDEKLFRAHVRKQTEEELLETQEVVIWLRIFFRHGLEM